MKKAISVIIAAVICLTCIIPAFADMEGPNFREYKAYISDPDGCTYTDEGNDEKIFIPYNTEVTVTGEYDNKAWFMYNDRYVSVSTDDLTKEQPDVDASEAVKLSCPMTYVVIAEEGAKIRKGPAESYDELGTIPYNTEITVTYGTEDETSYLSWAYCTYDGVSGWIYVFQYCYNYEFAMKLTSDSGKAGRVMTMKGDMRLTDKPDTVWEDSEIGSSAKYVTDEIPAGTEFTYDKYYCSARTFYAYVEYEGVKGWLESGDLYMNGPWTAHVSDDEIRDLYIRKGSADIYSEPFGKGSKTGTISEGEAAISYLQADKMISPEDGSELDPADCDDGDGIFQNTEYIEYGGVKGWITYDNNSDFDFIVIQNSHSVKFNADAKIFKDEDLTQSAGTITAGTSCYWLDEIWQDDNGICIWLYNGNIVYSGYDVDYGTVEYSIPNETIEKPLMGKVLELDYSIVNFEKPDTGNGNAEESSGTNLRMLIIIIAAAVIILFIAALVTIIFIKKKKSAKAKAETEEETETR